MRLFIALDIPDEIRRSLKDFIESLRPHDREARWVRAEGIHVTLKFIGETPTEKVERIRSALKPVRSSAAVELRFRRVGFFPNERRPRVFWAGLEASLNLAELTAAVEEALVPLGIPRESRPFQPHLTLARCNSPHGHQGLRQAIRQHGAIEFGSARVSEFHLYQSVLRPSGAEYTRLESFRFAENAA